MLTQTKEKPDPRNGYSSNCVLARSKGFLVIVVAIVASLTATRSGIAGEPDWPDAAYPYTVIDQDLGTVLQEFSDNLGILLRISDQIHGRVQDYRSTETPKDFLNELARRNSFEWYFDGRILHISGNDESVVRLLALGSVPFLELWTALDRLGIADQRFPLRHGGTSDLVLVSGPPRYVALVEQTLVALVSAAPTQVSIFRGSREPQS